MKLLGSRELRTVLVFLRSILTVGLHQVVMAPRPTQVSRDPQACLHPPLPPVTPASLRKAAGEQNQPAGEEEIHAPTKGRGRLSTRISTGVGEPGKSPSTGHRGCGLRERSYKELKMCQVGNGRRKGEGEGNRQGVCTVGLEEAGAGDSKNNAWPQSADPGHCGVCNLSHGSCSPETQLGRRPRGNRGQHILQVPGS